MFNSYVKNYQRVSIEFFMRYSWMVIFHMDLMMNFSWDIHGVEDLYHGIDDGFTWDLHGLTEEKP